MNESCVSHATSGHLTFSAELTLVIIFMHLVTITYVALRQLSVALTTSCCFQKHKIMVKMEYMVSANDSAKVDSAQTTAQTLDSGRFDSLSLMETMDAKTLKYFQTQTTNCKNMIF